MSENHMSHEHLLVLVLPFSAACDFDVIIYTTKLIPGGYSLVFYRKGLRHSSSAVYGSDVSLRGRL